MTPENDLWVVGNAGVVEQCLCNLVLWCLKLKIQISGDVVNTLRQRRNEQYFADDIFKRIFFNENVWISIKISLKFVPKDPINNILALVQIMAWCRSGDKPLSEPMMVSLPTHICVTRPQCVNVPFYVVKSSSLPAQMCLFDIINHTPPNKPCRLSEPVTSLWSSHVIHICKNRELKI